MSNALAFKTTGLAKTAAPVRQLAMRLERARQAHNEKIARADADYVEAVRRAMSAVESETTPSAAAPPQEAVS